MDVLVETERSGFEKCEYCREDISADFEHVQLEVVGCEPVCLHPDCAKLLAKDLLEAANEC